ncbi:hypothetical protein VitviT2T_027515 [Vitis vinifera]|uniref:C2 domain-containing protein n=2 Tax=Vitis vinifera TaxID=29760 RepID=A0ABY9DQL0_VITVI|eukprot:XP_002283001.1 PREDICTED: leucine-rich repeat extensin-like protein 3 [Vitis vinifera]
MSISGIQGHSLEVTVVGCSNLRDTEWISRQDPYVCLEYGNFRHQTKTCTDGGKNPSFQEKFICTLIEGLRELNVVVWNSNTLTADDFIGSGKIQLHKVLSQGYDDTAWPIQGKYGRYSGEVRFILYYPNANNKTATRLAPSVPSYATPNSALSPIYSYDTAPPPLPVAPYPAATTAYSAPPYPPATSYSAPSPYTTYSPSSSYPPSQPLAGYPQTCPPSGYPSQTFPPPPQPLTSQPYPPPPQPLNSQPYPPPPQPPASHPYPSPPQAPASQAYPPPPQAPAYYPSAQYPAVYPPPPY